MHSDCMLRPSRHLLGKPPLSNWSRSTQTLHCYTLRFGQFERARESHEKANAQLSDSGKTDWQAYRLPALRAQIELGDGQPIDDALVASLVESRTNLAQIGSASQEGVAGTILGQCYLYRKELEAAEITFGQLALLAARTADPLLHFHALAGLAQTAVEQGDVDRAIVLFNEAINQMESMRSDLQVESFRVGFLTDKLTTYKSLVSLHLLNDDVASAFLTVERSKALLVTEKLAARTKADLLHLVRSASGAIQPLGDELAAAISTLEELYPKFRLQSAWARRPIA